MNLNLSGSFIRAKLVFRINFLSYLNIFWLLLSINLVTACSSGYAQTPSATPNSANLSAVLNINELKISMAESSLKVNPSLRAIAELTNALEQYLNTNCFGPLHKTLKYEGPPTNPDCTSKMERLFEIYPENPVATCLRDGIAAESCLATYRNQTLSAFTGGSSNETIPDPALKVGLSSQDTDKVRAISATLAEVNRQYQDATSDQDKLKLMDDASQLYDQILSVACKIHALQLEDPLGTQKKEEEDISIREVRAKLLKIPPAMRGDYQNQLLTQAEEDLGKARGDKYQQAIILRKIAVIQNPDNTKALTAAGKTRVRVVLPRCAELIEQSSSILPYLPSPICHREGWYSPQCIEAINKWHTYSQKRNEAKRKSADSKSAPPTPSSIISSF